MNIYYVYAYLRKDGTPCYIGKGKDNRAYSKNHRIFPKDLHRIIFLERNLSEIGALALERRYIAWYGRKDNNTGILRNLTDGGESNSGWIMPEEVKQKIRHAKKGSIPWNTGKHHSDKTRQKLTEARKKRGPVSEETRRKMSKAHKNKPPEILAKYKEGARKRPPVTQATKDKMRESQIRRHQAMNPLYILPPYR